MTVLWVMDFEAEEHTDSTPPVSNNTDVLPHKRKNLSEAWNHFTPMPITEMLKSAQCNHCGSLIKYNGGTTAMLAHLRRCSSNPDNVVNVNMHGPSSSSMQNYVLRQMLPVVWPLCHLLIIEGIDALSCCSYCVLSI